MQILCILKMDTFRKFWLGRHYCYLEVPPEQDHPFRRRFWVYNQDLEVRNLDWTRAKSKQFIYDDGANVGNGF